jgi:hypothetical protein
MVTPLMVANDRKNTTPAFSESFFRSKNVDDEDITFCRFDVVRVYDDALPRWLGSFENVHLLTVMCVVSFNRVY